MRVCESLLPEASSSSRETTYTLRREKGKLQPSLSWLSAQSLPYVPSGDHCTARVPTPFCEMERTLWTGVIEPWRLTALTAWSGRGLANRAW